jgi:hypothetical protein
MKLATSLFVMLASAQVHCQTFFHLLMAQFDRPELLLSLLSSHSSSVHLPSTLTLREEDATAAGSTDQFLSSHLRFTRDVHGQEICMVKAGDSEVGVMMGWEHDISKPRISLCIYLQQGPSAGNCSEALQ